MNLKLNNLAIIFIFFNAGIAYALPPSDYDKDATNWYVTNPAGGALDDLNHILCMVKQTAYDSQLVLNQGYYLALIDEVACDNSADTSSAGAADTSVGVSDSANVQYGNWNVKSDRKHNVSPQMISAFVHTIGGSDYQAKINILEAATDDNELGIFNLDYKEVTAVDDPSKAPTQKGMITSENLNGLILLKYAQNGRDPDGYSSDKKVVIQKNVLKGTGQGRVYDLDHGNYNSDTPFQVDFAYDTSHLLTVDLNGGGSDKCFNRTSYENSAWRYGLYNKIDGARATIKNPGFDINTKANGTGLYGYMGYWGLWLPNGATLNDKDKIYSNSFNGSSNSQAYTLTVKKGILRKNVRHSKFLKDIQNISMQGMIDADGSKIYKISWDGTGLKIMASALAWGDTNWQAFISPVTIDRNYTLNYNVLNLWSDALGGQVSIALNCDSNVTGGYNCDAPNGETPVIYYSQETVLPRETIPSLACYENCPKMVNGKLETLSYNGSNSTPVNYNFNDGILEFLLTPNSPQSIPIIDTTVDGVYSGPLFEDNPENVQKLNCLYDGNQFCPWQARSNLDVYYTWSTSIHSWDNLTLIENDSLPGKFVKFDKPMDLNFTYPDTTVGFNPSTTDAKYKGSQFVLQYSSFGNLGNIPGHCIDPNNPGVVINDCSAGGLRWVPEFTIPVGVEVTQTINNKKIYYLIKPLEIEQRLAIADPSSCVGLVTDMTTEFLDIDKAWTDPLLGTEPSKSPLKVVAGVVQTSLRKAASSRE